MTEINNHHKKTKINVKEENPNNLNNLNPNSFELKILKLIEFSKTNKLINSLCFGNLSNKNLNDFIFIGTDNGEIIKLNADGEIIELKKLNGSESSISILKMMNLINGSNQDNLLTCQSNGKLNLLIQFHPSIQHDISNSPTCIEKVNCSNNSYYLVVGDHLGKLTGFNFNENLFQFKLKQPNISFFKNDYANPSISLETSNNPIDQLLYVTLKDLSNTLGHYYLISNHSNRCYLYSKDIHVHTIYFKHQITRMAKGQFTELSRTNSIKENNSLIQDVLISDDQGQIFLLSDLKPTPYINHGSPIQFLLPYRIKNQLKESPDYLILTDYSKTIYIYQNQQLITKLSLDSWVNNIITIPTDNFLKELIDYDYELNSENLESVYDYHDSILVATKDSDLVILSLTSSDMEL